ncbi:MAG: peptidase M61 [Ideonella sp. MAG2]|nr:MAG: peptidase M61 [Ideonella sp. MAG2]
MIAYRIEVASATEHRFAVTLTVPAPSAQTRLSLPVWIPGSYLVREFGRHLSRLTAHQGQRALTLTQLDKTTWQVDCTGQAALTVRYEVYAFDASVRTAFLDDRRGFFNPTSLCLSVQGREHEAHSIELARLPKGWAVATAMTPSGKLRWQSADYDELIDHPFELGAFWRGEFVANGVAHEFVVAGAWPGFDGERLLADTQKICATQISFWHGRKKPPFSRYVFMLYATEDGYGGLEHRASTALIANRRDLPRRDQIGLNDGYVKLLGLISHEYFHTWNVKRLKPAEFVPYELSRENYTELLWFFEGFTSYYDDLFLLRAGLIDAPRYLKLLAQTWNGVRNTPGRHVQSVAESSFDAWVKYYRIDENSPNATISYYTKGALVALLLDLRLRQAGVTGGLDLVMRSLWARCKGGALTEADVLAEVAAVAGAGLAQELASWVHGRGDLPLEPALKAAAVQVGREEAGFSASLGLKLTESVLTGVQVKSVLAGSAAAAAGVSAGDEILAVNGWRVRRLDEASQWLQAGEGFDLTLCRQQRLATLRVERGVDPALTQSLTLGLEAQAAAAAKALRQSWIKA